MALASVRTTIDVARQICSWSLTDRASCANFDVGEDIYKKLS